ncbi:aminotransferase class I/II-fold pyridoxal phosphate-dependent enzyme [uncultured Vagococcus sp.]|uniref:aminotransferase class I/II-fold pyridoxal phosphate-dependent enzyme n=1 Tax=uncultured Vagococcus sp. TaxID=189676 RepID=UPI0025836C3B|nr:aminotransferase class I/II-fold pyridoxal phosphate-dependent enzyme [uncultured Vagococcus sp.]
MRDQLSDIGKNIESSGIRRFFSLANEMDDVVSLGVGEPDFKTAQSVRDEAISKLRAGATSYTPNAGLLELRELLSDYLLQKKNVLYQPESEIIVTAGSSHALDIALRSIVNFGDEVIIIEPTYVAYKPLIELAGGKAVVVPADKETLRINLVALEKAITDKTKAILICTPNNPTGVTLNKEELQSLANIIETHDLVAILDEIYSELVYEGDFISLAGLENMKNRSIVISGFSKGFSMTGWRLGYVCAPKEFLEVMIKIQQYTMMSAPTIAQYAAIEALKNTQPYVEFMKEKYMQRRDYLVKSLNELGLMCQKPEGAFYAFPSIKSTGKTSEVFCEELLMENRLAVVPGSAFGASGEGFIRCSYAYSINDLEKALDRLDKFLNK